MKQKGAIIVIASLLIVSLLLNGVQFFVAESKDSDSHAATELLNEEYVYIAVFKDDPMIKVQDELGLKRFSEEYGVKVSIEAPEHFDAPEQARIMDDVIKRHPAGIMVCGSDPILIPYINKAIEQGIPTITVDADLPQSKRLAFVGSDWRRIGIKQAETMVKLIGGKGEVAMLGIVGLENMQDGFDGFRSVMENYNDVYVFDEYDDMSNIEEAERITVNLIKEHPQIAGIAGFDSNSGPGIIAALKKLGMVDKIKVTTVDIAPIHLQLVKEGSVQKLIGQKRELFTYYGGKILYDFNHSKLSIAKDDKKQGITNIPNFVDTGLVEVDATNVDKILRED